MADNSEANLIINLVDNVSSKLKRVLGGVVSVSAAVGLMKSSFEAFLESEAAVSKLDSAISRLPGGTKEASNKLQELAGELQKVTRFSDEQIVENQALLTTFGLNAKEIGELTPRLLDLSTAMGIDLRTASIALGKAIQTGNTDILKRYGISIDDAVIKSGNLSDILAVLDGKFKGAAVAAGNTAAGQIEILKNRLDELKEKLGAQLVPALNFWSKALETSLNWVEKNIEGGKGDLKGRELTIQSLKEQVQQVSLLIAEEEKYSASNMGRSAAFDELVSKRERLLETLRKEKILLDDTTGAGKKNTEGIKESIKWTQEKENTVMRGINQVSSLQSAKTKEMAALGKTAAIADTTISTYAAATAAFKALAGIPVIGPALAFSMAGAITAAGLANVAKISGVELAHGGVVMPTSGGTIARIGEAGSPEAVIPLNDSRAKEMIGGGNQVIIQAGVIVADDYSLKALAEKIDEKLFELKRNRQTLSI